MLRNPPSRRQARLARRPGARPDLVQQACGTDWKPLREALSPGDRARLQAWSQRSGVRVRLENSGFLLNLPGETVWRVCPREAVVELLAAVARDEAWRQGRKAAWRRARRVSREEAAAAEPALGDAVSPGGISQEDIIS